MLGLDLRPLTLGEILDRSFVIYRRYFLLFLGIAAIPQMLQLAFGIAQIYYSSPVRRLSALTGRRTVTMTPVGAAGMLMTMAGLAVGVVVYTLAQGGTLATVTELYLGRKASIAESLQRAWEEFGTLFATAVLNGLAVFVGLVALVIPGAFVVCRLIVCLPAALVEGQSARDFLTRSWELTKGYAGRSFVLVLLYFALTLGIAFLLAFPLALAWLPAGRTAATFVFGWRCSKLWVLSPTFSCGLCFLSVLPSFTSTSVFERKLSTCSS